VIRAQQEEHEVRREAPDFHTGSPTTIYLSPYQWHSVLHSGIHTNPLYYNYTLHNGDTYVDWDGKEQLHQRVRLEFKNPQELTLFRLRYSDYL
jgi:hypothetical protein